jgi:hypothetical protein
MKPATPPPCQPNGLPFESLDQLFRTVIAVPKVEIDRREEEWKSKYGKPRVARKARRKKSS